jgi:hypothetical protein
MLKEARHWDLSEVNLAQLFIFNVTPSMPVYPKWPFSLTFQTKRFVCISYFPQCRYFKIVVGLIILSLLGE